MIPNNTKLRYDMTIDDVLFFDTETTGIPDRSAKWDSDFMDYPHVVQMAWLHGCKVETHIIRPDGWEIPQETVDVHGITTEYALEHGEPFASVVDMFIQDCNDAGLICGHNIHFDTSIIKANILRELGREYYDANDVETALYKGKRIDTMRPAMKWVDARMANGRLKFPNLTELYARCFPGESFPAHDALEDVRAVAKCLPVLVSNGIVKLEVKEYENADGGSSERPNDIEKTVGQYGVSAAKTGNELLNAAKIAAAAAKKFVGSLPQENFPIGGIFSESNGNGLFSGEKVENDKLPVGPEKVAKTGDSEKLTGIQAELLEQNDF